MRPRAHPTLLAKLAAETPARLVKKLDAEPELALAWTWHADGRVETSGGEVVRLHTPDGSLKSLDDLVCSCLLAPRCLHRLAVLSVLEPEDGEAGAAPLLREERAAEASAALSATQREACALLWQMAASFLEAGGQSCGVVGQGQLLRAAFACREAGLHRAQASATRVVQGVRALRAEDPAFSLEAWTQAVSELLLVAYSLHQLGQADRQWIGTARRPYEEVGNLSLWGLFSEPVLTATGYAGVITWLTDRQGRLYQLPDVAPGDPDRVLQAYRAGTPLPGLSVPHADLARARLLIQNATVSEDGRLGSGQKVAAAVAGPSLWEDDEVKTLWHRGSSGDALRFFQGEVMGAEREVLLVLTDAGPLRLRAPSRDPLPGYDNLRLLARQPGRSWRWIARVDPYQKRTATVLAVQADGEEGWLGRCNLGCDRMHASHFSELKARAPTLELPDEPRPFAELQRALGRVAMVGRVAARDNPELRRVWESRGQRTADHLWGALVSAADQGERDLLGFWRASEPEELSRRWLALSVYLDAASKHWSQAGQLEAP
jgi:hypothetical protein